MHLTPDHALPRISVDARIHLLAHVGFITVAGFTSSNPWLQSDLGIEERLFQIKWLKDFLLRQLRDAVSRHTLKQNAERYKPEIAVDHTRARFVLEIEIRDRASRAFRFVLSQNIKRTPCGQTGTVRQKLAHGDHLLISAIELRQVV